MRCTRAGPTASRLLVAVSARSLGAVGERVTLPRFRMLVVPATHGAASPVVLADQLQVALSTAMRRVDRLIAAGPADRRLTPGNRRETPLRLTDEGRCTVEEATARRRVEPASVVARLVPQRRATLVDALTAFNEAGDAPPAPAAGEAEPCPPGWASSADVSGARNA